MDKPKLADVAGTDTQNQEDGELWKELAEAPNHDEWNKQTQPVLSVVTSRKLALVCLSYTRAQQQAGWDQEP